MDSPLPVKVLNGLPHVAAGKLLDHGFQLRVFLTRDFIEPDRLHACILKLREGTPGLHSLMLPTVAYQQYAVVRMKPVHKFIHLTGRCQRRFVEDIEPLLSGVWLLSSRQMLL